MSQEEGKQFPFLQNGNAKYLLAGYCEAIDYLCVVPNAAQHTVGVQ